MTEAMAAALHRFEEVSLLLQQPEVAADLTRCRELMKEYKKLEPLGEMGSACRRAEKIVREAETILREENDRELCLLAQEELLAARAETDRLTREMELLLLPHDPNDEKSVIMEIRAGTGGEEAALFAAVLYRMYTMAAAKRGWRYEVMSVNETELGGYKEIIFSIEGEGVYSRLKFESGVHRVQRVPVTDSQGKIQTSAVTVAVLPEADEVEIEIDPKDLKIDTYRASGAGGQHINKTESAIRITHLPTGLVVECQDERSQYKNKDRAMKVLRSRLLEQKRTEQESAIAENRRSQVGSGDRSGRIRTYNYPQGRVTDHRVDLTLHRLDAVLNGELDPLTDALLAREQAERLGTGESK